jgi:predicted 3-demethylubiquinone-9 3-methyltransferase (glyoxalase superfamily)
MQTMGLCLWFDNQAEEAVKLYTSLFKNSKITNTARYDDASAQVAGKPKGSAMTVAFQLNGIDFMALNGGPMFKFTEANSIMVTCDTQDEVDALWNGLTRNGGEEGQCGWLKDKFGLSWQIIPKAFGELMSDPDPAKTGRVMQAMLKMKKLDANELTRAFEGK